MLRPSFSVGPLALFRQQHGLDVGQDASPRDGHTGEQPVQFLVVAHGQQQVARVDGLLFVVPGGVSCELQYLCSQVFHHSGQVDWGAGTDAAGIVAFPHEPVNAAHWELKPGTRRPSLALPALRLSSFSATGHVAVLMLIFPFRGDSERCLARRCSKRINGPMRISPFILPIGIVLMRGQPTNG